MMSKPLNVDFFTILSEYVKFFPLVAFMALMLAGINVPVSEDLVIITGAMISRQDQVMLILNLASIYAGVLFSDIVSFWIGRGLNKGIRITGIIKKTISVARLEKIRHLLEKHGILTFIICRFIPFGVRNTLFISSGITGLPFKTFLLFDVPASLISVNTLYFLVYYFGDIVEKPFRAVGVHLFLILLAVILITAGAAAGKYVYALRKNKINIIDNDNHDNTKDSKEENK